MEYAGAHAAALAPVLEASPAAAAGCGASRCRQPLLPEPLLTDCVWSPSPGHKSNFNRRCCCAVTASVQSFALPLSPSAPYLFAQHHSWEGAVSPVTLLVLEV